MKILILSHAQYITVGLPKIIEFAESLLKLGHNVTLCVTSKTKRLGISQHKNNGINVIEFPSLLFGNLRHGIDPYDVINRIIFLKNKKFDIIHCIASRPTVFYPGIFLRKKQRSILIYEWEDSFAKGGVAQERGGKIYYQLFGWIEKYYEEAIVKHADGLIVVSNFLKERAIKLGAKKKFIKKQIKGTNFINQNLLSKNEAKKRVFSEFEKNTIIFSYAGSIYESDLNLLFGSFKKASLIHPNIKLLLVGYNRKLPKKIPDNAIILPRVEFEKFILYLAATDVFVLPLKCSVANISRYPSKFGDYLAIGRPVIATPLSEIKNIIETGQCGYVAPDDTVQSFSEIMLKAINDRIHWPILGKNARHYALHHLSGDLISKGIIRFYEHISGMNLPYRNLGTIAQKH